MEDPKKLVTEATAVLKDCERVLGVAAELVDGIPARREEAQKRDDAARKRLREAEEKWRRVYDDNTSREKEREAAREYEQAQRSVYRTYPLYRADDLDPENRKAVARQLAGLVREESWQRLNNVAARSEDPEVQRTVARCKDEVSQATYRLIKRFKEARPLEPDELRTTRAEAYTILDGFRSPPAWRPGPMAGDPPRRPWRDRTGAERKFSGSSEVASRNRSLHLAVTDVAISSVSGGESGAGEHLKADPHRDEREFVTANFREFGLCEVHE